MKTVAALLIALLVAGCSKHAASYPGIYLGTVVAKVNGEVIDTAVTGPYKDVAECVKDIGDFSHYHNAPDGLDVEYACTPELAFAHVSK